MTYIAAFPCQEGYVCCADTLEVVGDEKQYVEKLAAFGDGEYPFCIGGAGTGEIIDALTQEISERILNKRPQGCTALTGLIKTAVRSVYGNDVPVMALKKQMRTAELLIAINSCPNDSEFCLFHVKGQRIFKVERGIIGYSTSTNQAILERFHDPDMPMSQAVMLAVYLVAQSKLTDDGVGGDTRVGIVSQLFAKLEEKEYIESIEARIKDFLAISDLLFLHLADMGSTTAEFESKLQWFVDLLKEQRRRGFEHAGKYLQHLVDSDQFRTFIWPYPKIPVGSRFETTIDPTTGRMKAQIIADGPAGEGTTR
jgi:20S proteasome alpha/beta subunit